jgi:hypothetical protein
LPRRVLERANQIIYDETIRHAHSLSRLGTDEARRILRFFSRDLYPDIVSQLERARLPGYAARGLNQTRRLQALGQTLDGLIHEGVKVTGQRFRSRMKDLAEVERGWTARLFKRVGPGIKYSIPDPTVFRALVEGRPMLGEFQTAWWRDLDERFVRGVRRSVNLSLSQGQGVRGAMQRLKGTAIARHRDGFFAKNKAKFEAHVRTTVKHVESESRRLFVEENKKWVKLERWISILDAGTTDICASLSGNTYKPGDGPYPPQHFRCRSERMAELKDSAPAEVRDNYEQWLSRQTLGEQNEAIGTGKARLWRQGKVEVRQFVDAKGRPLTLEELREVAAR